MTFEELQTILCEIEAAIINRLLAYLSEDDLDEALTPLHLVHRRSIGKRAQSVDFVFPSNIDQCRCQLIHVRKVLRDFWTRFRCTYSNELRQINIYWKSSIDTR